jgi:hypothetical protein
MGVMSKREAAEILGIRQDASLRAAKVAYRLVLLRRLIESLADVFSIACNVSIEVRGIFGMLGSSHYLAP